MRLRPPTREDAERVTEIVIARDVADFGEPDYSLEDLLDEWGAEGFDLAVDAAVVEDGDGRLIGYAAMRPGEVIAAVDPAEEGRGAGSLLLEWSERRAAARGHDRHRQDVGDRNASGAALLRAAGYEQVRSDWRMLIDLETAPDAAPPPPAGIHGRALDPDADGRALYEINARAFASVSSYRDEPFERFQEEHLRAATLDPGLSVVAERDGAPVGFALCRRWADEGRGYIDLLAVDPAAAGGGLGSWLLLAVFARCKEAGLRQTMLGVASDNPRAAGLYERAGMRQHFRIDAYERDVEPAG